MSDAVGYQHVNELISAWNKALPGVKLYITQDTQQLILHLIEIPLSRRRQGYGTEILAEICSYADYEGLLVSCVIAEEHGTSETVLQEFYAQHGFQPLLPHSKELLRKPSYQ